MFSKVRKFSCNNIKIQALLIAYCLDLNSVDGVILRREHRKLSQMTKFCCSNLLEICWFALSSSILLVCH